MTSKGGKSLLVLNTIYPTLQTYGIVTVDTIEDAIDVLGFTGYLTVADIARYTRIQTGEEYTACDDNHVPVMIGNGSKMTTLVHPSKVKRGPHQTYLNWLGKVVIGWQNKHDKFQQQM